MSPSYAGVLGASRRRTARARAGAVLSAQGSALTAPCSDRAMLARLARLRGLSPSRRLLPSCAQTRPAWPRRRARRPGPPRTRRGRRPRASGGLVVAREVGVEHRRVVGRDGAEHAGLDELRQRVLVERADRSGADVRHRARRRGRSRRSASSSTSSGSSTARMPCLMRSALQRVQRTADRLRAGDLARVRHGAQSLGLRQLEDGRVRLRRELAPRARPARRRRRRARGKRAE